ncbi:MAG TPA: trypsin-like peptidase domain-containing protein [Candidatus Limnocylindrales bacterium]|nr:trypsin-like peptidase domain-containing protein [Candidatus Limnocylindrales bacterium]
MAPALETIVIVETQLNRREALQKLLREAGYEARAVASVEEGFRSALAGTPDLCLLAMNLDDARAGNALSELKELSMTSQVRVVVLTEGGPAERARALQMGADDVLTAPWDDAELLARVRAQLREKRELAEMGRKLRNSEESYQVAQTAFQALAVTEKMTRDAFSLERILKIGVGALMGLALVIAAIFFLYSHKAEKETRRAYLVISQLEHSVQNEEQLLASTRRLREDPANADVLQQKEQLQQKSEALRQKLSAPDGGDVNELRRQLDETTSRLSKIEGNSQAAESVIRDFAPSVCLLHVSVAFNEKESGRRLRYGGINSDGSPLKDSEGNTVYTTEGRAPELRADFFGTGFIAGEGTILTNHHVVQPWWQNEELGSALQQGLEPVIAEMMAYFPGEANGIAVRISKISQDADLAAVHGDLSEVKRPVLKLDGRKDAAVSGEALISVGYATGLDAILARAGDETVSQIVKISGGDPKLVLAELAKRKLIRPLVTQGHVGDVLPDKIVYDAQTTSGGSGGPLLNRQGGVIGVTFAIVRGFGGSNFGVPIRFATPLLKR